MLDLSPHDIPALIPRWENQKVNTSTQVELRKKEKQHKGRRITANLTKVVEYGIVSLACVSDCLWTDWTAESGFPPTLQPQTAWLSLLHREPAHTLLYVCVWGITRLLGLSGSLYKKIRIKKQFLNIYFWEDKMGTRRWIRPSKHTQYQTVKLCRYCAFPWGSLMDGLWEKPGCGERGHVWSHCLLVQPVSCAV